MSKAFETWTHAGARYIAIPQRAGVFIMRQDGTAFGDWPDVKEFRRRQKANSLFMSSGTYKLVGRLV